LIRAKQIYASAPCSKLGHQKDSRFKVEMIDKSIRMEMIWMKLCQKLILNLANYFKLIYFSFLKKPILFLLSPSSCITSNRQKEKGDYI